VIIMAANTPEQPCMAYVNVVMMSNIFRVLHWSCPPISILAIAKRKQTAQPHPGPPLIGPLTRTPSPCGHDKQWYSLQREYPTTNKPTETKTPSLGPHSLCSWSHSPRELGVFYHEQIVDWRHDFDMG
jgi:hypothetical protein